MYLNAMYTDPTMIREALAMEMFSYLGHPAPRYSYYNLYINGVYEGLYLNVERVDNNFISARGLGRGTLVRDQFRSNRWKEEIDGVSSFFGSDIFLLDNAKDIIKDNFSYRGTPNWDIVEELGRWVYETPPGPEFAEGFTKKVNIDNFIDWLAIHIIIQDIDSYSDDYWLYYDETMKEGKWIFIPWDKDLTFGSLWRTNGGIINDYFVYNQSIEYSSSRGNRLISKVKETEDIAELLYDRIDYLINEVFTKDYFEWRINYVYGNIQDYVYTEPSDDNFKIVGQNHFGDVEKTPLYIEAIMDFIELRYAYINHELREEEGDPYISEYYSVEEIEEIILIDSEGFVISKIELENPKAMEYIQVRVEELEEDTTAGIDRLWTLEYTGEEQEVILNLYYKNDLNIRGNWYIEEDPIGNQINLKKYEIIEDRKILHPTKVNPFSNKVTSKVTLKDNHQFIIKY